MECRRSDLDKCRISYWYPLFRKDTIFSRVIPLPEEFIDYLQSDGIVIPNSKAVFYRPDNVKSDYEADTWTSEEEESDSLTETHPFFASLSEKIEKAIEDLGGCVFAKLTWSSPKDSMWLSKDSTAKCKTPTEIFLLLKGSDFVMHDITEAYHKCIDVDPSCKAPPTNSHELVLRKWLDLRPSMEFRVFIKDDTIIAISQRDTANHYDFLTDCTKKFQDLITNFYHNTFSNFELKCLVIDLYIYSNSNRVLLIDINPFTETTDSLLFTWDEILEASQNPRNENVTLPIFRVVQSLMEVSHRTTVAYSTNKYPREAIQLTAGLTIEDLAFNLYQNHLKDECETKN